MSERTPSFLIPCALEVDEDGVIVKVLPDVVWLSQTRVRLETHGDTTDFRLEPKGKEMSNG
jgi:hypothetical protein